MSLGFLATVAPWRAWPDLWAFVALGTVLIAAAVSDVRTGKVYNWITYPAVAVALVGHTLIGGLAGREGALGLAGSAAGFAVGFLPLLAAWLAGGIGGGDAKLMGAVGALAGWRFAVAAMFYGFAVAAVLALAVLIRRRRLRRTLGSIGRFLLLLLTPSKPASPAAADSPKIPFGLALCVGAGLAIVEVVAKGAMARKFILGI